MQILNPLYDNAFKYLMEDSNIAKIILSVILNTKVIDLQAKPQETSFANGLLRFDYKAVIRDEKGEDKTILIEVQKYNSPNPIKRFREYLGINYARTETIKTKHGTKEQALPLVAIYILGFNLSEFDCRAIRYDNIPYDIVAQKPLKVNSKFGELLTHKCYILIANEKNKSSQDTLVEKLLNLFIQKLIGEKINPVIEIDEENYKNELLPIIERLKRATLDSELLRKVQVEQDYIDSRIEKEQQLEEAKQREREAKQREEEAKQREEEAKQREEEAKQRERKAKQREEEERLQKEEAKRRLAKKMLKYGELMEDIIKETGLTEEEIRKLNNIQSK